MKERKMSCVKLYNDGHYVIESASPDQATQQLWFRDSRASGLMYYCIKGKERHYLKRLINSQMKQARARLDKAVADYEAIAVLEEKITSGEEL